MLLRDTCVDTPSPPHSFTQITAPSKSPQTLSMIDPSDVLLPCQVIIKLIFLRSSTPSDNGSFSKLKSLQFLLLFTMLLWIHTRRKLFSPVIIQNKCDNHIDLLTLINLSKSNWVIINGGNSQYQMTGSTRKLAKKNKKQGMGLSGTFRSFQLVFFSMKRHLSTFLAWAWGMGMAMFVSS